ncbi:MAG: dynamin family protein [Pseudomonadota bacterium]
MMHDDCQPAEPALEKSNGKPCVALMGEFSAGKSTLLNLLLAQNPLPMRVTATNVPPVWISYGNPAAARVGHDGSVEKIEFSAVSDTSLKQTKYIRLWLVSDALEICDLIDMPGISDPNLPRDMWMDLMDIVDSVIWCTHATQAWRQSESSVWDDVREQTNGNNLLVVTQFDKIREESDRRRLLARLEKETRGLFKGVFPVALIEAIRAKDKSEWAQSGASAFSERLVDLLLGNVDETDAKNQVTSDKPSFGRCDPQASSKMEQSARMVKPRRIVSAPSRTSAKASAHSTAEQ